MFSRCPLDSVDGAEPRSLLRHDSQPHSVSAGLGPSFVADIKMRLSFSVADGMGFYKRVLPSTHAHTTHGSDFRDESSLSACCLSYRTRRKCEGIGGKIRIAGAAATVPPHALPLEDMQASDLVKMSIARRQRQSVLESDGRNPNVIFWNRSACLRQLRPDATIMFRGHHGGHQWDDSRQKIFDLSERIHPVVREVSAAIQFPERRLRQVEGCDGLDLNANSPVAFEVGDDYRSIQHHFTTH